jgi:hypothetical protein
MQAEEVLVAAEEVEKLQGEDGEVEQRDLPVVTIRSASLAASSIVAF